MRIYYNEIDHFAAGWLRNLMAAGLIPAGDIDDRSIADVRPEDVRAYEQCHFFAGIGGWPYALDLAGWGDRPAWTGSCPCQPLSSAGQRRGHADERHLWPAFHRLVAECRPATIFGEQVASRDGREWLAGVRADLEALGYAVGGADLCASGVGAPHIRQRLFWVADADGRQSWNRHLQPGRQHGQQPQDSSLARGLADANKHTGGQGRSLGSGRHHRGNAKQGAGPCGSSGAERLGHTGGAGLEERPSQRRDDESQCAPLERAGCATGGMGDAAIEQMGRAGQPWQDGVWLDCLDGKARRIEPKIQPLAHGVPNRVGLLRGAGNAIVPQAAAEFIKAFLEI